MLRVHLKEVLNQYGYTLYDLSDAIIDLEGISESTVYRFGRGGQNLTLNKLELILRAVRSLTGQPIRLSDLISDEGEATASDSEESVSPSKALVLLSAHEPEHDIDEVWELVTQRTGQRAPERRGMWWFAASAGALAILGLVLLGGVHLHFPLSLPSANPAIKVKAAAVSVAATSSHTGASPAVHMELKKMNSEGHAIDRPICKVYKTPADTKPVVTECPTGVYKEQLFDEEWVLIGQRDIVVGQANDPNSGSLVDTE